jgi:hypothetical protein
VPLTQENILKFHVLHNIRDVWYLYVIYRWTLYHSAVKDQHSNEVWYQNYTSVVNSTCWIKILGFLLLHVTLGEITSFFDPTVAHCKNLPTLLHVSCIKMLCTTYDGCYKPCIQWIVGALSLGVDWPECEDDHPCPTSAEVKNVWSYTSTPPYVFMAWCLVK